MEWWYSQDEERWNGPCATRDEAIEEGRGEYGDDQGFMVMEAEQGDYNLNPGGWRIIDWLDDANCDLTDPDSGGIADLVPKDAEEDLGEMVAEAIKAWAAKHKINTRAFMFTKQMPSEDIEPLIDSAALTSASTERE